MSRLKSTVLSVMLGLVSAVTVQAQATGSANVSSSDNYVVQIDVYEARDATPVGEDQLSLNPTTAIEVSLDKLAVNFGSIYSQQFSTGQTQILVNSNLPAGFRLYAQQNHALALQLFRGTTGAPTLAPDDERQFIPPTSCDAGDCTAYQASTWNDPTVNGFGFTVSGRAAAPDFDNGAKYRPFTTQQADEQPALIASIDDTSQILSNELITVDYQVAASVVNQAGVYSNAVSYTVVPSF